MGKSAGKSTSSRRRKAPAPQAPQEPQPAVPEATAPPSTSMTPSPERTPIVSAEAPLVGWVRAVRAAVGSLLDLADAAAEAITKRLEGRT